MEFTDDFKPQSITTQVDIDNPVGESSEQDSTLIENPFRTEVSQAEEGQDNYCCEKPGEFMTDLEEEETKNEIVMDEPMESSLIDEPIITYRQKTEPSEVSTMATSCSIMGCPNKTTDLTNFVVPSCCKHFFCRDCFI